MTTTYRDMELKCVPLKALAPAELRTHRVFHNPDPNIQHIVVVSGQGIEIACGGTDRAEALHNLIVALQDLTKEVREIALEQEGVLGMTVGEMLGSTRSR